MNPSLVYSNFFIAPTIRKWNNWFTCSFIAYFRLILRLIFGNGHDGTFELLASYVYMLAQFIHFYVNFPTHEQKYSQIQAQTHKL